MTVAQLRGERVIRQKCEVLSARKYGAYHSLTLVAPEIAEAARPGQFVQVAVPDGRDFLLRRPFSIHQASRRGGWSGTLEFVLVGKGPGTNWLTEARSHDMLDVIGPLGKPFLYPRDLANCLLIGGGYGAAPLYFLAEELRARGKRVDMILGAREQDRVFKPVEGKRLAVAIAITTEDGSLGDRGMVTDVLPSMVSRCRTEVVYACGPNPMLRAVAEYCIANHIPCQVAVEEMMGCGVGVCWTCVVPVIRRDARGWDNLRACVEGPVFTGSRVWWEKWLGSMTGPVHTPPHGFELDEAGARSDR
ncbi:MAG TPA: dihydroorotate dehydrogenase electron transfer subunit [Actinomycetota bacterium]|jgi:dihydroorotate dehydrogenase electron transfer subunit|nr:dihydroorotate dehydrogenase electron transfer subunit [Actinomycetota bacterium]